MSWFDGWQGGWPLEFGGGPGPIETALNAMRSNVGRGHAADSDGVEWRWREARALTFATLNTLSEQALAQHSPATAVAALSFWAELYDVPPGLNDQQVRDECTRRYEREFETATCPTVEQRLQEIDPRFSLTVRSDLDEVSTYPAVRAFEDFERVLPFNFSDGRDYTRAANYSTRFILFVRFVATYPEEGSNDRLLVDQAVDYLQEEIPAWCDFQMSGSDGFYLDISQLDWTGLTEV